MRCPYCNSSTKVTNSRSTAKSTQTWRRRQCIECDKIWTTTEAIDLSKSHQFSGSDNHLQPFSRDILFISIKDSLQHRKTALSDATALTDTVLGRVLRKNTATLPNSEIVALTYDVIRRFDKIAASVYKASHRK